MWFMARDGATCIPEEQSERASAFGEELPHEETLRLVLLHRERGVRGHRRRGIDPMLFEHLLPPSAQSRMKILAVHGVVDDVQLRLYRAQIRVESLREYDGALQDVTAVLAIDGKNWVAFHRQAYELAPSDVERSFLRSRLDELERIS